MAATAISLHFRTKHRRRRPITNPSFLHFFSSSTPSSDSTNSVDDQNTPSPPPPSPPQSQSSFSSYFSDVKARLKQQQTPSKAASPEEIRKRLAEFNSRYAAPPPANNSSHQQQPISFQELYKRRSENSTIEASNKGGGGGEGGAVHRPAFDTIRESLRQLHPKKASNNADQVRNNNDPMSLQRYRDMLNMRPVDPNNGRDSTVVIGGTDKQLPVSVFGKELREKKENESVPMRTEFTRRYGYDELGVKLRKLRPESKKGEWFSLGELNERLMKLRELEEKEMQSTMAGVRYSDLRRSLMTLQMSDEEKTKKQMSQRLDVLGQLGGTPNFLLSPPKDHLVEKYFHPDHMSSSEKMKLELQKVRDEFKMSESDCGSARVQVAQLTTKIKHLSTALHKKDKHSRKGLQAMVQRRKKLLKYLRTTDWDSYCLVLSKLGLRDNPDFKILTYPRKST